MRKNTSRIIGVLAVALTVVGCSDEKKTETTTRESTTAESTTAESTTADTTADEGFATASMAAAIQTTLDLGVASESSAPDLDVCPLGDFDALVAKAPPATVAGTSTDGEVVAYIYQPEGEPPHLQCGRGDLGAYTGLVTDGDYKDELTALLDDFVLTFDDDVAYLDGTIVSFCAEPIGVGDGAFCETDWYDDNVWVGAFIYGAARSSELSAQWLTAILSDVISNVPQLAPTVQLVN